jgi:gamma-glutamylcyclotransferase (GGCT)/AIG2-like uncharacterized protein YtfP
MYERLVVMRGKHGRHGAEFCWIYVYNWPVKKMEKISQGKIENSNF